MQTTCQSDDLGSNLNTVCWQENWNLFQFFFFFLHWGFQMVLYRISLLMQEDWVWSLGWEDYLEKEMATHSSILAWEIPWTKEPDGLLSIALQSQAWLSDWAHTQNLHTHSFKIHNSMNIGRCKHLKLLQLSGYRIFWGYPSPQVFSSISSALSPPPRQPLTNL